MKMKLKIDDYSLIFLSFFTAPSVRRWYAASMAFQLVFIHTQFMHITCPILYLLRMF